MTCELFAVPADAARQVVSAPSWLGGLLDSAEGTAKSVSLEKAWHGLHFVLTGTESGGTPPLSFLAAGGEPVGHEDFGYGPARVLHADQVAALHEALSEITEQELARRLDPERLAEAEVYPMTWDEPLEDLLEEYGYYLGELKALVARAAHDGDALIIVIQ